MTEKANRQEFHDEDRQARAIAERVKLERDTRGWSLAELAARSGVSKAMISKIERCEASPTASVLGRLSGAFGLPLSVLLAMAEREGDRLARRSDQPVWVDPETGYTRRTVSPANGGQLELLDVVLPVGVRVPYPASAFSFQHQQILVLEGELTFIEGSRSHQLSAGDCLQLGAPSDCVFVNESGRTTRYLVALTRRG
jgi:transcriptional regulator with XRE-family HTH domain